jgi:hypothetical protein
MTSFSSVKVRITQTGPKISSRAIYPRQKRSKGFWEGVLKERHPHIRFDVGEDVRLDKVSVITGSSLLSNHEFGAFLLAEFDVLVYPVKLDFGNLWALVGIFVKRVADFIIG